MEAQNHVDTSNGFVQLIKHIGTTAFKISKPFKSIRQEIEEGSDAYITIPTCLFEVVVGNYSSNLSALERIFYVVILTHYQLNKTRAVEISAEVWAKHLGIIDCDAAQLRSKILRVQRSLECTRTKLFVPIKYNYLKQIFKDIFRSHSCKLFLLRSYISVYKNYQTTGKLSFCATINPRRTLKSYYPLSLTEIETMNEKSHREFSLNFANMTKAFRCELHRGTSTHHQSFRFSCNIVNDSSYTDDQKIELYLSQIENSCISTQETELRCKIANVFQQNHCNLATRLQLQHISSISIKRGGKYV